MHVYISTTLLFSASEVTTVWRSRNSIIINSVGKWHPDSTFYFILWQRQRINAILEGNNKRFVLYAVANVLMECNVLTNITTNLGFSRRCTMHTQPWWYVNKCRCNVTRLRRRPTKICWMLSMKLFQEDKCKLRKYNQEYNRLTRVGSLGKRPVKMTCVRITVPVQLN